MRHLMPLIAVVAISLSAGVARADLGDQLFKLLPEDGAKYGRFGFSVATTGSTAIVGAWRAPAYLLDTTTGQQIAMLLPRDGANNFFGRSVAISGATAIIGASGDKNGIESGSAYLFDTTTGQQIAKLLPDDGAAHDQFGFSVGISGDTAIVGAWQDDDLCPDEPECDSGSAYLFDTTTGQQIAKLLPDDGAAGDNFGISVAISGTTAIVGAHYDDDNGPFSGSAYLFSTATGQQIAKLLPDDGTDGNFGRAVAISGNVAIVGTPFEDDNGGWSGSAYLFDTITGNQIAKLLARDGSSTDLFGMSVGMSGTTAIVGAYGHGDNGTESGSAYLFDAGRGHQIAKLLPDDGATADRFGRSVAISGTVAIAGASHDDDNGTDSGSAYLFDADTCPWDFDGDGNVGPFDLAYVLGFWGPNRGHPADLDGDGEVGPLDLAILLGAWGRCP